MNTRIPGPCGLGFRFDGTRRGENMFESLSLYIQ